MNGNLPNDISNVNDIDINNNINMFDPNEWGFIFLVIGFIFFFIGKAIMSEKEKEEKENHKYVTLKSGKRVQIK